MPIILWGLALAGAGMTIMQGWQVYRQAGNDLSVFIEGFPFIGPGGESSAECKAFMDKHDYHKPGWCAFTGDAGGGPDPVLVSELNSFYISLFLTLGAGGGAIKWGRNVLKAAQKSKNEKLIKKGKEMAEELLKKEQIEAIKLQNKSTQETLKVLKKLSNGMAKAANSTKGAKLSVDIVSGGRMAVKNNDTGEVLYFSANNQKVLKLLQNNKNGVDGAWELLKKVKDNKVSPGGVLMP